MKRKTLIIINCFTLLIMIIVLSSCNRENGGQVEDNIFYRIQNIGDAIQYKKLELALYEKELKIAQNGNPYDYNYYKVVVSFTSPSGYTTNVNAFWYQDYEINVNTLVASSPSGISGVASTDKNEVQGLEIVSPIGNPHYRVRFMPIESGKYKYSIKVYCEGKLISTEHTSEINVEKNTKIYQGVIEVDPTTNRNFRFSQSKQTYIPIGQNNCWYTSSTRKTEDYRIWFDNMNQNNMNVTRIWMAPWGFAFHWGASYNDFSSRFSQAARLDKMVELADEYEIYFMLCLNNHGQFSSTVNAEWNNNPYNVVNGGILTYPYQFFSLNEAKEAYKNELLYIIARYGYSDKVMCWELFNEVDWIDSYSMFSLHFKSWHEEMSSFIKQNDPYHHMVTTSYKGEDGNANILDNIAFTSPHSYNYKNKNINTVLPNAMNNLFNKYNKPVFQGEIGLDSNNGYNNYQLDKTGISLHQSMWAGFMGGGAGGAMNWWWDSYVHPYKLYSVFQGAGSYAKLLNLSGNDYQLLNEVAYQLSNTNVSVLGYAFNNRIYGYLFDRYWTYYNNDIISKDNVTLSIPFTNGTYKLTYYNTKDGSIISTTPLNCNNQRVTLTIPSFVEDIAFIIE